MEKKDNKFETDYDVFSELYRRVDLTRRSRIKAAERLRSKSEFYERLTHIYTLIILVLSIWFIDVTEPNITKVLLILSLSLTFSTMFLSVKNYKERASNFENNYQQLNVLLDKMQRLFAQKNCINQSKLKELHREYEKLMIGNENHLPIDYMSCNKENESLYQKEIEKNKTKEFLSRAIITIIPGVAILLFVGWVYLREVDFLLFINK